MRLGRERPDTEQLRRVGEAFNEMVGWNGRVLKEIERVSTVVGYDGRLGQRSELQAPGSYGEKLLAVPTK